MKSYMEMIYIDSEDLARHTDLGVSLDTNKATWAAFRSYRHLEVASADAQFLLDYHDAKGDLVDTICLDAAGFRAITGQRPKTDKAYQEIDRKYWAAIAKPMIAARSR